MSERVQIAVFVMMDEAGDYVIHKEREELAEAWTNDIGDMPIVSRVFAIKLDVEKPADVELTAQVDLPEPAIKMATRTA